MAWRASSARAPGSVVLGQQRDSALERLARLACARPSDHCARETALEQVGARARVALLVDLAARRAAALGARGRRRRCERPAAGAAARRGRRRRTLAASGHARPQLERALEQRGGLAVGVHALGGVGGAHGRASAAGWSPAAR